MGERGRNCHSPETIQRLKAAALRTHGEVTDVPESISRRELMIRLMGASAALALGLSGCERKPKRKIISRAVGPEYQTPGEALYYSSTWTEGSYPYGIVVKTVDGRPIKIEGNPDHPVNAGTSSAAMQASILSLYDPDRLRQPTAGEQNLTWKEVDERVVEALRKAGSVVLLVPSTLGPSERELLGRFMVLTKNPKYFVFEAVHDGPRRAAWKKAYGLMGELLPRYDRAQIIVSIDSDFLGNDGVTLESTRHFSQGRILDDAQHKTADPSRLYVAESVMSLTGSNADQRLALRPSQMLAVTEALRAALKGDSGPLDKLSSGSTKSAAFLNALVVDLRANKGRSLVVAGGHLPEAVHASVAMLNDELESSGKTLEWHLAPRTSEVSDPKEIEAALDAGPNVLICWDVNPVYAWAGDGFDKLIRKAGLSIGHGAYLDETLSACDLALPSNHNLESWNDAAPREGVASLCQPVIAPLFDTRQTADSILKWAQALSPEGDQIRLAKDWHGFVRERWKRRLEPEGGSSDAARQRAWEGALRLGGRFTTSNASLPPVNRALAEGVVGGASAAEGFELVIHPHHAVADGRYGNNGWLHELPDPVSKLVWDNAASVSPGTAKQLAASEGDLLTISVGETTLNLPALIQPGMPDNVVAVSLGYGRTAGGVIASEAAGVRVSPLLSKDDPAAPRLARKVSVAKGTGSRKLVRTQKEFSLHGRPIVLDGTLAEYRHAADFVKHKLPHHPKSELNTPWDYSNGPKWGMVIDLNRCVGCSACMIACQAENNIPIVGREECSVGREMHWMRLDRYETDDKVHHQPMLCQHCDDAPCEIVCPVNATTHSPDGLNEMTYNRCVGTRYCANNCPYKVRRFNFLRYQDAQLRDPVQELAFNPHVTVRGVGVMEKCTFCVQRLSEAKYKAKNKNKSKDKSDWKMPPNAVQPACAQACPAQAIVFGNVNEKADNATKARACKRAFHVLEEINIKPNVSYLARVRNPNPAAEDPSKDPEKGGHA